MNTSIDFPGQGLYKQYKAVNMHKDFNHYNRLLFGVASTMAIFQQMIEGLPGGISKVCVHIDNMLITRGME